MATSEKIPTLVEILYVIGERRFGGGGDNGEDDGDRDGDGGDDGGIYL